MQTTSQAARRLIPNGPTSRRLSPVRQIDTEPLALVHVRHEGLAIAVLGRALAHILEAGLVVHHRIHLLVAGIENLRPQPVAESARRERENSELALPFVGNESYDKSPFSVSKEVRVEMNSRNASARDY